METMAYFYTAAVPAGPDYSTRLLEEIAYFETRLETLRNYTSCAYDRALVRSYEAIIDSRRKQLATIKQTTHSPHLS